MPEKLIWIHDHRDVRNDIDDYTAHIRRREFYIVRDYYRATGDFRLLGWWHSLDMHTVIEVCPRCQHYLFDTDLGYQCSECGRSFTYEQIGQFTKDLLSGIRQRERWNRKVSRFNRRFQE